MWSRRCVCLAYLYVRVGIHACIGGLMRSLPSLLHRNGRPQRRRSPKKSPTPRYFSAASGVARPFPLSSICTIRLVLCNLKHGVIYYICPWSRVLDPESRLPASLCVWTSIACSRTALSRRRSAPCALLSTPLSAKKRPRHKARAAEWLPAAI